MQRQIAVLVIGWRFWFSLNGNDTADVDSNFDDNGSDDDDDDDDDNGEDD